jgi:hypothetical protein
MKNLFVQKEFGYCTVYALANIFRDKTFLRFVGNEEFKGCDDEKENRLLAECGYKDVGLASVLYVSHSYKKPLPPDYALQILTSLGDHTKPNPEDSVEIPLIPYLLAVRLKDTHEFHHAAAVLNYNGVLLYIDPYKEDIIVCEGMDLFNNFIDCYGIKRFYMKDSDTFAILKGENLNYNFLIQ